MGFLFGFFPAVFVIIFISIFVKILVKFFKNRKDDNYQDDLSKDQRDLADSVGKQSEKGFTEDRYAAPHSIAYGQFNSKNVERLNRTCPSCHSAIKVGFQVCPQCGSSLTNICPRCHLINHESSILCQECYGKLPKFVRKTVSQNDKDEPLEF